MLINHEKNTLWYLHEHSSCLTKAKDNKPLLDTCWVYIDTMRDVENLMNSLLAVGILLPISFYGGGSFFNYIFPKRIKTKKLDEK